MILWSSPHHYFFQIIVDQDCFLSTRNTFAFAIFLATWVANVALIPSSRKRWTVYPAWPIPWQLFSHIKLMAYSNQIPMFLSQFCALRIRVSWQLVYIACLLAFLHFWNDSVNCASIGPCNIGLPSLCGQSFTRMNANTVNWTIRNKYPWKLNQIQSYSAKTSPVKFRPF